MHRRLLPTLLLVATALVPWLPVDTSFAGGFADDGRAAVVLEVQGTALVQPAGRSRWTPLSQRSVLFPGDLVRTDSLGAHALEVQLKAGGKLVLGPGTVLELPADGGVRLLRGELEAAADGKATIPLRAPGAWKRDVKGTAWLRSKGRETKALDAEPKWLRGYRASAGDEWMGSLLANVDGREVPLAVGYHKVGVEIRDQIARTTVEQSFVNTTDNRLEGVFYFPLPADASISGFGMWIAGELVEADIVEKQRARQIYEDILRRKKDPGLLEWEGGNLFKARVFPIEPHSEKRIRIRYTQVLPLEGATFRYRYALRSELLRTKPLRRLDIAVRVVSSRPITEVGSPTHEIKLEAGEDTAVARFTAQEYSPERDFELAVTLDGASPITALPHRRGEDGYFMLQLTAPDEASGGWQRDLTPEGKPLDLVLVADTSGSMDTAGRRAQERFLRALLALLGERDTFRLLALDVEPVWVESEGLPVREDTIARAMDALGARRSLGWSDLDAGLAAALSRAGEETTVVYVGDGIGTTGDADPVALADRLRRLADANTGVVHAVAPASTYEQGVLEAMATIGGGSVRSVGVSPAQTAYALLSEVARPAVKDLRVSVEGLRTARVYPETLPNLPAGRQHVVLGRFLPADAPQTGRVTMTGTLHGKPVRYSTQITVPAADVGNSFLPRLWARKHLDALLAQGRTPEVKEEVVEFSERFGIMTPYTSFLVLESDEDRERYGVERRVKMRDGERFFADAADKANLEARRNAMKRAGTWRLGLRRTMLREIADLGRGLPIPYPHHHFNVPEGAATESGNAIGLGGGGGGAWGGKARGRDAGVDKLEAKQGFNLGERRAEMEELRSNREVTADAAPKPTASPMPAEEPMPQGDPGNHAAGDETDADLPFDEAMADAPFAKRPMAPAARKRSLGGRFAADRRAQLGQSYYGQRGVGHMPSHRYIGDLGSFLVYRHRRLPAPLSLEMLGWPGLSPAPDPDKQPSFAPPAWDEEILALVNATWRRPLVTEGEGAFHFTYEASNLHPTRGTPRDAHRSELWVRKDAWYAQNGALAHQPYDAWVHGGKRGSLAVALRLARTRDAEATDAGDWGFAFQSLGAFAPAVGFRTFTAKIIGRDGDLVTIALTRPGVHADETQLLIDAKRGLLVEQRQLRAERVVARMTWSEPIEVGGAWWPTRFAQYDAENRLVRRASLGVEALERAALDEVVKARQAATNDVITVHGTLPTVDEAKQARHDRKAGFVDEVVLALHFAATQQWDETWTHWEAAEKRVAGKPGARFARSVLMQRSRRGEAFKAFLAELATYVDGIGDARRSTFLAPYLQGLASGVLGYNEQLALLTRNERAWIAPDAPLAELRRKRWLELRARLLGSVGRAEEARAVRRVLADSFPHDVGTQIAYENDLWATGRRAEALDHLGDILSKREPWLPSERQQLYVRWTDRLWQARDLDRLQAALTVWLSHDPADTTPYMRFASLLYLRGNTDAGDRLVQDGLAARLDDTAKPEAWSRQDAAARMALGYGWQFRVRRVEPMYEKPLLDLVLHYARSDQKRATAAHRVMGDWRFRRTQAWRDVRAGLRADLAADTALEGFSLQRLGTYIQWLPWDRRNVDADLWRQVVDGLRSRYAAAEEANDKNVLARYVLQLLDAHGAKDEALAFLRERMAAAKDAEKHRFAQQIWGRLLQREFDPERENELFRLLSRIAAPELSAEQRRSFYASQVRVLAERVYTWRRDDHLGPPASRKELTRAALKALRVEARAKGRAAAVSRLKAAALDAPEAAREWMQIERLGYAAELGTSMPSVTAEATGILSKTWAPDGDPLDRLIRERAAAILAYAATRHGAPAARVDDALALFALGTKVQDELLARDEEAIALLDWRYQTFRLLVAVDRPDALAETLATWIVPSKVESRWRIALAYVQAELGRLEPAVRQLEAVEAADELGMDEYRTLADWYLVLDEDAKHAAARLGIHEKTDESTLANQLSAYHRRATRRNGVPEDLDPEALRIMRVLMRKSQWPANHIWRIRNFYRSVKDFRLLESMVDGLTGHTKEGIYNFLQRFGQIGSSIHEEATCDAIVRRIDEIAKDDSLTALDRRALLLLTALIEQRAAQVPETDPTHEARALAALKQAQQGDWQQGERRLMADFLAGLRFPTDGPFMKEQMRQLRALFDAQGADTSARLAIGHAYAKAWWGYKRPDEAIDALAEAIRSERARTKGVLTSHADNAFNQLIDWLGHRKRFRDAETRLLAEMRTQKLPSRVQRWENKLFQVYSNALYHGGSTSLGRGEALFETTRTRILAILEADLVRASPLLNTYGYLHEAARHGRAIPDAGARLRRWMKKDAPAILARLPLQAHAYAGTLATNLRNLLGENAGLEALLDHSDRQSPWIGRIGHDIWSTQTYNLARWRAESTQALGDLDQRLFALVARGLERKLVTGDNRGRWFWTPSNKWYWGAKRTEFMAVATRILELHETKPAVLKRVAHFQRSLGYGREAIATILRALEREHADVGMRWTLVSWLHTDGRNEEALPLIAALVQEHPATLRYWRMKIDVQGALGQKEALALTLKEAEAWYRQNDRWAEGIAAGLGEEAVQHGLSQDGVRLYEEAIQLRIAARGYKGGRDTRLARYYRILADGLGGLGRTDEAVRAVSAALVAGSRSQNERNNTVNTLQRILDRAPDLVPWTSAYEAEVEKTGLDATPIRKALAKAYGKRGDHKQALRQLLAAREVDPRDGAIHKALVATYDRLGDTQGAIEALFGSIRLAPQHLEAYEQLAERYGQAGNASEAERALTTLVEITPNDAAGHQRLAEIRLEQKRLAEAAVQWRQVIRTRSLEPTGYLGLVPVLIELGETDEARRMIDHLMKSEWEDRFGDVRAQAARLLRSLQG